MFPRGHFIPLFQRHHSDLLCTFAQRAHCHVNGHIAAPDYDDPASNGHRIPQGHIAQKINTFEGTIHIFVFYVQTTVQVEASSQEEGLIPILFQTLESNITAKSHSCLDFYTHVLNEPDFSRKNVFREAILRDSHGHHTAGKRQFLKHSNLIPLSRQEVGRCQTGRT